MNFCVGQCDRHKASSVIYMLMVVLSQLQLLPLLLLRLLLFWVPFEMAQAGPYRYRRYIKMTRLGRTRTRTRYLFRREMAAFLVLAFMSLLECSYECHAAFVEATPTGSSLHYHGGAGYDDHLSRIAPRYRHKLVHLHRPSRTIPWGGGGGDRSRSRNQQQASNQFIVYFDESKLVDDIAVLNSTDPTAVTNRCSSAVVQENAAQVARLMGGTIRFIYQYAFCGVAIELPVVVDNINGSSSRYDLDNGDATDNSWDRLLERDEVAFLQQDDYVYLDNEVIVKDNDDMDSDSPQWPYQSGTSSNGTSRDEMASIVPTGLDRIDQTSLPLDGQYKYNWDGTGVTVFVIDTGVRSTHSEFTGNTNTNNGTSRQRPTCGFDAYRKRDKEKGPCFDHHNHGSHVAAIIGGASAGVAKNVTLVAVKVIGRLGFGSDAAVYAGIDYVLGRKKANPNTPMVANMALGGIVSWNYNRLVRKMVKAGIVVVAAAGNRRIPACLVSPASASWRPKSAVITVGASTYSTRYKRDRRAGFSNFGRCVDIFAPGTLISSATGENDVDFLRKSGTSFAAPHVAGAAALYLQKDPTLTPPQVRAQLLDDSTKGQLMPLFNRRSPNRLLHTGNI